MNNLLPHQAKLYEQALMYMQGQENMYGGLRITLACHMGEVKLIDSKVKSTLPEQPEHFVCTLIMMKV